MACSRIFRGSENGFPKSPFENAHLPTSAKGKNAPKAKEANASSQSIPVLVPNHLLPTYEPPIFYYQPPQFYYPQQAIYGYMNYTTQNYTMQQSVAPLEIPNVAPEQVKVAPKVVTPKHEEKPITSIVGNKDDFELPAWVKTIIPRGMAQ